MNSQTLYQNIEKPLPIEILSLPSKTGTYALILELKREKLISVGKLGKQSFKPGYYIYFGSAFGPGGLQARIKRHSKSIKKQHWHIDYLRRFCSLVEVWINTNTMNFECAWSGVFSRHLFASSPIRGFGSSDCKCFTHLFYSTKRPTVKGAKIAGK